MENNFMDHIFMIAMFRILRAVSSRMPGNVSKMIEWFIDLIFYSFHFCQKNAEFCLLRMLSDRSKYSTKQLLHPPAHYISIFGKFYGY